MSDSSASPVLIARQPILTSSRGVFGYELTFCLPTQEAADPQHQSERILESLSEHFDPTVLANSRCILVRLTPKSIVEHSYASLPPAITIIELAAADIPRDESFREACLEMKKSGYRLCLTGSMDELERTADPGTKIDYLKVTETRDVTAANCHERIVELRNGDTLIIACGIEQQEQFDQAKQAGFDFFEGYFFFKPQVLERREIPHSQTNQIRLVQAVNKPNMDATELEKVIRSDASLSVGIMRLINSAAFGISHQITSIQRALHLLGPRKVRRWATSIVTKDLAGDKPEEVIAMCLTRAFFCESLGVATRSDDSPLDLFMMGIVSGLPVILDVPMLKLLDELSVGEYIRIGLRGGETVKGHIFKLVCAHENGEFTAMTEAAANLDVDLGELAELYQSTVSEVQSILGQANHSAAA